MDMNFTKTTNCHCHISITVQESDKVLFQDGRVSLLAGGFRKPAGVVVLSVVMQFCQRDLI